MITRRRTSGAFLGAGLVAVGALVVVDEPFRGWLFLAILLATVAAATVAAAASRRLDPSRSGATSSLLAGLLLLVPPYVLWYPGALAWDLDLGTPSITDVLFLSAYTCFLVSMARLIRRRGGAERGVQTLDTLIISVGLAVPAWIFVLSPYLSDDSLEPWAKVAAVSYPVVDLLLLSALIRLLVQRRARTASEWLLGGWVAAQLAADSIYTSLSLGGTFTYGLATCFYALSFVLLGAALLHPSLRRVAEPVRSIDSRAAMRRLPMLGGATLIAPAGLVYLGIEGRAGDVAVVAFLAAVLFALVLGRVALLMVDVREHRRVEAQLMVTMQDVRERSNLAERLSRIQREISSRAPLQDVLDAITAGAGELLGDPVVGLRLIDEDDPDVMVMVSSTGVDAETTALLHRLPVGTGVGGRALVEDRLCIAESYSAWDDPIDVLRAAGLRTAMAAPVHLEGQAIGSLVVASFVEGRTYSQAEQDMLSAFAEHASLALNDAHTVQAMKRALEGATHQATHDALTGLPNRACFYDRTDQALRAAARDGSYTAVLLFDLDRFKEINDTLGHRYGDRLLCEVGPRISQVLRDADTLARLGGDEFCVLLPRLSHPDVATDIAARILDTLDEPFDVDDLALALGASCGVAVAPEHGDTADQLLQRADVAMYVAKASHAGVVLYDDELNANSPARLGLLAELRSAIPQGQLTLHYQPQLTLDGAVEGIEALVRWQHPSLGLVPPDEFVPLAEDTGLIKPLTTWVLRTALGQLRSWIDAGVVGDDVSIAVNLSARSLLDEQFHDEVVGALADAGVHATRLRLEVTETSMMADPARARRVLVGLSAIGVRFAIDDFGTGYSSLAYLKNLPVDQLKIDKSFVLHMHDDPNDALIVRAVVDLARNLGLHTVAEGVEDEDTRDLLAALGCDAAQGWLFARAMPTDELEAWLAGRRAKVPTSVPV